MRRTAIAVGLLVCTQAAVADPPPLRNNPFSRPPAPVVREAVRFDSDTTNAPLVVIATMVSSSVALANIEGQVTRPGEEIRGYLLKHVYEDRVVFERDGNELTIYVKPEYREDDVQRTPRQR